MEVEIKNKQQQKLHKNLMVIKVYTFKNLSSRPIDNDYL